MEASTPFALGNNALNVMTSGASYEWRDVPPATYYARVYARNTSCGFSSMSNNVQFVVQ